MVFHFQHNQVQTPQYPPSQLSNFNSHPFPYHTPKIPPHHSHLAKKQIFAFHSSSCLYLDSTHPSRPRLTALFYVPPKPQNPKHSLSQHLSHHITLFTFALQVSGLHDIRDNTSINAAIPGYIPKYKVINVSPMREA